MKKILSILLLCFFFSATAQPNVNSNCYDNDDLGLYFISDIHFRSYLNSELNLMCNDSLITNSIYHGPNAYQIDIAQDYQVITLDGLQFIDIDAIGINNNGSLQYIPDLSNFLNLIELHITNCSELEISGLSSLINLESLVITDLISFSDITGLSNLKELVIGSMSINELPDLSGLVNLEILNFHSLPNVNSLPDLSHLSSLNELHLSELDSLETLPHIPNHPFYIEIYNTPNLSCVYEEITSITIPYYIYNLPFCEGTGCSNPDFFEYYSFEESSFAQSNGAISSTYQLNGPLNIIVVEDDGSCNTEIIYGCSDSTSNNYALEANVHTADSCTYLGCTDIIANNYNSWANIDNESCEYIYGCLNPSASNYYPWTTNIGVDSLCIFIEETDSQLNDLQNIVDSLSSQLQSFLETYIPPVVEEEVVSDANSFDVLNPLSYNGEFEAVHYNFSEGNYTVPSGKTLIINQIHTETSAYPYIDGVLIAWLNSQDVQTNNFKNKLIVSENEEITIDGGETFIHGVIINRVFETFHHDFSNGSYIVPESKILLINQFYSSGDPADSFINGVKITEINTYYSGARNTLNKVVLTEFDTLSLLGGNAFAHGIIIDNSNTNFTYATDYELIEALNEGMDSLSTLSEVVAQENDSLTTENAILTEENEALMLIEYNYDSLQYVTEYLYSQVFDLQQELLVPNIDVDMAIGWNMIGFSCPEEKGATDALIDIVDEILIMKDNNGSVYMPEFGFNGIGDLTPGHGYQLKVTDYILDFNICE